MKPFTKGFAAGATALAVAVPAMAHIALAASGDQAASRAVFDDTRPVPSQACTEAMADLASAHLDVFEQMSAERKVKMQEHRDALVAAAAITDDEQRREALKASHASMHPAEKLEMPEAVSDAMEVVKAACGDMMRFKMGHGPMGGHRGVPFMKKIFKRGIGSDEAVKMEMPMD